MKWVGYSLLALALASPPSRGDDPPPKDKDGKKEASPKAQYDALVKEFTAKRSALVPQINKAKGEEQQKLIKEYRALGGEFADRFLKLADENAKDPVGADALFWVVQNAAGGPAQKTATDKVVALVGEMPAKDLAARLGRVRVFDDRVIEAVVKRAEKEGKDPAAGDLLAWVATSAAYSPHGPKAAKQLIETFPAHPALERVCLVAADMEGGDALLKQVLAKDPPARVKAAATLGLGKALAEKVDGFGDKPAEADRVAAEAEKYLAAAVDLYKDTEARRKEAEGELRVIRTLRVGKVAPDIKGPDLDGKEFKLSDYRGKVVLLDFWGHW
jgi:hypothetical protein